MAPTWAVPGLLQRYDTMKYYFFKNKCGFVLGEKSVTRCPSLTGLGEETRSETLTFIGSDHLPFHNEAPQPIGYNAQCMEIQEVYMDPTDTTGLPLISFPTDDVREGCNDVTNHVICAGHTHSGPFFTSCFGQ